MAQLLRIRITAAATGTKFGGKCWGWMAPEELVEEARRSAAQRSDGRPTMDVSSREVMRHSVIELSSCLPEFTGLPFDGGEVTASSRARHCTIVRGKGASGAVLL
jgi:hypothetical protein